jgi:hypothetical protein
MKETRIQKTVYYYVDLMSRAKTQSKRAELYAQMLFDIKSATKFDALEVKAPKKSEWVKIPKEGKVVPFKKIPMPKLETMWVDEVSINEDDRKELEDRVRGRFLSTFKAEDSED